MDKSTPYLICNSFQVMFMEQTEGSKNLIAPADSASLKELPAVSGAVSSSTAPVSSGSRKTLEEMMKTIPSTLATFISQLPVVEGICPVISGVFSALILHDLRIGPMLALPGVGKKPGHKGWC